MRHDAPRTAHEAAKNWATIYGATARLQDKLLAAITYTEAEALADILSTSGAPDLALTLIRDWLRVWKIEHHHSANSRMEHYKTLITLDVMMEAAK